MARAALALAVLAATALGTAPAAAVAAGEPLRLEAGSDEVGWVSLAATGPAGARVELRELTPGHSAVLAGLTLRDGTDRHARVVRWRCDRRERRFSATTLGADRQTTTATITTPSCKGRLRMIVVPARVRPGRTASVSVVDGWGLGDISATVCAGPSQCRRVRVAHGRRERRVSLRLRRAGRRTIALRTAFGQQLSRRVSVREDARLRVLVTGDSMIFGIFEALGRDLGKRGAVLGDPHPGRGITTPGFLDWPAHARSSALRERPDATVVVLGAADAGYPLTATTGEAVECCGPRWIYEYARIAGGMMESWQREGRGLVYWVILPAPRSAAKAIVLQAENEAVRQAAAGRAGVRVVERIAGVLSPGDSFHESIVVDGTRRVVRDDDGVHLSTPGVRIATNILRDALRQDGLGT